MNKAFLTLLYIATFASEAHAYLDPASGNALLSFVVALAGSAIYLLKSVCYKLFKKNLLTPFSHKSLKGKNQTPVIISEGKSYWSTFKPIVDELIEQKVHFRYISLDVHDPGLTIDNEYMDSKRYPENTWGFSKINKIKAPLMLSTTPNIGWKDYPMKRPEGVQELVHVFHALANIAHYHIGSLDQYDTVLLVGAHEEKFIRQVEKARDLKRKKVISAGLPYWDEMLRMRKVTRTADDRSNNKPTILVAPSWGAKGCFFQYGTDFTTSLAEAGYNVIIRLHPQSHIHEPERVKQWEEETRKYGNIVWDQETLGNSSMEKADIMISDTSSIRLDLVVSHDVV